MNFLKKIFRKKDKPIKSYNDFWNWFKNNEKIFFDIVKNDKNIENGFFDKLSPKLDELKDGFFFLIGMSDENTVELVLTADGAIENIVFVEELVSAAPKIMGWKFTALKPALDIENVSIQMDGYEFNKDNLSFFANEHAEYPDEIDITIVHNDFNYGNQSQITRGAYIFLDNFLGELDFISSIDNMNVMGKIGVQKELVPITKLKDFLKWRQKEFVEKYEEIIHHSEDDMYATLSAELSDGSNLIAIINADLLNWDRKASHPWILKIKITYKGNENGMPDEKTYSTLDEIEDEVALPLKDFEGYLFLGRQTANNEREIYWACKEFRKPSKIAYEIQQKYSNRFEIDFEIYKDKYWQSFERFNVTE